MGSLASSAGYTGLRCVINDFALPGMSNCIANGSPTNGQVGELQNRGIEAHGFVQCNNSGVLVCAVTGTDELPTVIVGIVTDVKNWFFMVENFACDQDGAVPRLSKWPTVRPHHLTRKRQATAGCYGKHCKRISGWGPLASSLG
jgi:hypothetical protein